MHKRIVGHYVEQELKKGKTLEQIRKKLIKSGHDSKEVAELFRTYELRENDLMQRERKLSKAIAGMKIATSVALVFLVINAAFFFYYFNSPHYVLVRETPTGLMTEPITRAELKNIENSFNVSENIAEGSS